MTSNEQRPNVVLLFTDDQRYDTIQALGDSQIQTPHMDDLVRRGTAFTHAHVMGGMVGAICMPSRAMLLSGRGLFQLKDTGGSIPKEHVTLPEMLRENGYTTFHIGKWHNDKASHQRSFSSGATISAFVGGWYQQCDGHWNVPVFDFDPTGEYPKDKAYLPNGPIEPFIPPYTLYKEDGKHSSELFTDSAVQFIEEYDQDSPFFLYLAYRAPHDPRQSPKKFWDMYDADTVDLPENFRPNHPFDNGDLEVRDEKLEGWPRTPWAIRRHIADYFAIISHVDYEIGRVIKALEEKGIVDNTIIILAGDNGLAVGQHGLMGKQNLYEHSIRVPLVFCGPGIPVGERRSSLCYLYDIYPTVCDLLGLPVPESVTGISLADALDSDGVGRAYLYCAYKGNQRSVRNHQYKLIEYVVNGQCTTQLFDVQADPKEMNSLAGNPLYEQELLELRSQLAKERDASQDRGAFGEEFWTVYNKAHDPSGV